MARFILKNGTTNKESAGTFRWQRALAVICFVLMFAPMIQQTAYANSPSTRAWRSFQHGIQLRDAGRLDEALAAFCKATAYMPENSSYQRQLAELLERMQRFEEAADAFEREAAIRRRAGETQAALVQERRASSLRSGIKLFVQRADARA